MSARGDINEALNNEGVTFQVQKAGAKKDEWKLRKVLKPIKVTSFLTVLRFLATPPWASNDTDVQELIMLESKDTCVVIVLVNEKYVVLSQQHRPTFSRIMRETLRGWFQKEGGPLEILRRKIPRLLGDPDERIEGVGKLAQTNAIIPLLQNVPEDPGLRTNSISYYLINVDCKIPQQPDKSEKEALQAMLRQQSGNSMYKAWVFTIEELETARLELMALGNTDTNPGLVEAISLAIWDAFFFYRSNIEKIKALQQAHS